MNETLRLARGVILVGFDGTMLHASQTESFSEAQFAGYLLFARNIATLAQTRALTDALRALHDVPPIIAIDQEGGRVARLHDGVETLPSMMALGATQNSSLAQAAGEQLALDLRRAGCSLDFAPVIDLAVDPRNTVIGTRAFGTDVALVSRLARALADGLERGGVVPTFKHFPGHGATAVDSHLALPVVDVDERTLRLRDLAPFAAIAPHARAMMSAHVVVRALDPDRPATLSPRILTALLRDELRFDGVCFTDCLQMDAIARGIGTIAGVSAAIAAGADCALVSHDPDLALRAAEALARDVDAGRIPRTRLRDAYDRVQRLRRALAPPLPLDTPPLHRGIGRAIGRHAVCVIRGVPHADATASIVVSFENVTHEGAQGTHTVHARLNDQAPVLAEATLPLDPTDEEIRALLDRLGAEQRRPIVLARRAHLHATQAAAIRAMLARMPDALVVSTREPFDLACFPTARHLLATCGDDAPSIAGLADVLFGGSSADGRLPVDIVPDA